MPRLLSALAVVTLLCSPTVAKEPKSVRLFNGKDLSGWHVDVPKMDNAPDVKSPFIVREGMLVSLGSPGGHLITDEKYENYRLEVQYRFAGKPGNCGVLVHASEPRSLYKMFPKSIEVQMMNQNAGDFWCICEDIAVPDMEERRGPKEKWGVTEGKARRIVNLTDGSERPVGQWNTMIIECLKDEVKVWVNGELVNHGFESTAQKGQIAVQAEGSEVEFRKLELTPITKLSVDQGPILRRGHAQTPEEARAELQQFKKSYSDLAGWEQRKGNIREGILRGAGLSELPEEDRLSTRGSQTSEPTMVTSSRASPSRAGPASMSRARCTAHRTRRQPRRNSVPARARRRFRGQQANTLCGTGADGSGGVSIRHGRLRRLEGGRLVAQADAGSAPAADVEQHPRSRFRPVVAGCGCQADWHDWLLGRRNADVSSDRDRRSHCREYSGLPGLCPFLRRVCLRERHADSPEPNDIRPTTPRSPHLPRRVLKC